MQSITKGLIGILASSLLVLSACSEDQSKTSGLAEEILQKMTIEEKVGQVIQADISAVTPEEAKEYNLGSVLNGGNSAPYGGKTSEWADWIKLADAYWVASTDNSDGGVGIPIIWGTDAVHGHNNLQSATIFPHNSALGATRDVELMQRIGQVTAREVRATGLDWVFGPTIAVARDDRWGRAYESYSENPELVAELGEGLILGLQGEPGADDFLGEERVVATAKHFIADGGTQFGIDKGDTILSKDDLVSLHGLGYVKAFEQDVQTVMSSFSSVNGEKMHGSKDLLTGLLRDEMGFEGFVIGDWNGHAEVPGCTATDCPESLLAGVDMYMAPDSWKGLYASVLEQVNSGEISQSRLDEAVLRILKVKESSGLLANVAPSERSMSRQELLGSADHRAVARESVRKSLVLLKNKNSVLPLNPSQTILVAGSGANSIQQQTGGWTLSWQGNDNKNDEFENADTILAGIEGAINSGGGNVIFSEDASAANDADNKPDVAVVVFGEQPYAEYVGDVSDLVYEFSDGENLQLIKKLKNQGITVVSVFLTGRPLWVNEHINASDAFVVAWLPGTEGAGVADVLVANTDGEPRYAMSGKLAFSWPSVGTGEPINDASDAGIQYPFGFGLSYQDVDNAAELSSVSGVERSANVFKGDVIIMGAAVAPFSFFVGDSSNANTPASAFNTSSLGNQIASNGTDYVAQEDSRMITWTGGQSATVSARAQRSVDLTSLGNVDLLGLHVMWRLDKKADGPINIGMSCGEGCVGGLDISNTLGAQELSKWTKTEIPLACFVENGLKADSVYVPFGLRSAADWKLSLHSASVKPLSVPEAVCPN